MVILTGGGVKALKGVFGITLISALSFVLPQMAVAYFVGSELAVVVGSIIYKICIQIAINLGLPANLLKLVTAVLFLTILVLGNLQKGKVKRHA